MPLNAKERDALRAEAERQGMDPDEFIAGAEAADEVPDKKKPDGSAGGGVPPAEVKVYQYHLPFMTVNEVRAFIGLPATAGGDVTTGEWLASHGGVVGATPNTEDQNG